MLSSLQTLAVAALLLVVVASLPAPQKRDVWRGIAVYVTALLAGVALVSLGIRASGVMTASGASELRKYAVKELARAKAKNVLLIDGGSYPARAIDERQLTKELASQGYSVHVVHLALGAGNHFERFRLYEDLLEDPLLQSGPSPRWVFLAETQEDYDRKPLAQLGKNQDTARAYHYLTPSNAWYGLRALESPALKPLDFEHARWTLLRHSLVNVFNAGVLARVVPSEEIEARSGFVRGKTPDRFRFKGLKEVLKAAGNNDTVPIPDWVFEIRERRLRALFASRVAEWIYFGVPSTNQNHMRYVRSFCGSSKDECISPDVTLLQSLDDRLLWVNKGHLSSKGAEVYTSWLARRLVQLGVLER